MDHHQGQPMKRHGAPLAALGVVAALSALYLWGDDAAALHNAPYRHEQFHDAGVMEPRQLDEVSEGSVGEEAFDLDVADDEHGAVVVDHNYDIKHSRRKKEYYETSPLNEEDDIDTVVASLPGTWRPKPWCPVPRVLLVLYGQMRSFASSYKHHASMAEQASSDCYLVVAVTDEEICATDPHVPGRCLDGKGWPKVVWATGGVAAADDAWGAMNVTRAAFDDALFGTVYQSKGVQISYGEKVGGGNLWGTRMHAALRNVVDAFASHGTPLDPERTVVIRTRFDLLPLTYPVFDWDQVGPLGGLFRDENDVAIVYGADFHDCQPDLHVYSSLRGYLDHVPGAFLGYTACPANSEEPQTAPLIMDDDWNLCRRDILRTSLPVKVPEIGLTPVPVGRNRRLYCNCPPEATDDGFKCYSRFQSTIAYSAKRDTFRCPAAGGVGEGCSLSYPIGPVGCYHLPCEVGHINNAWYPELA